MDVLSHLNISFLSLNAYSLGCILTNSKAGIAQLVERNLAKVEVASSNLVSRSTFKLCTYPKRSTLVALFQLD